MATTIRRTVLLLAGLAILPVAQADQAIVVGVEEYAPLVAASTLKGCLNDANGMAEVLRQQGFKVNLMTNGQATRAAIFKAIQDTAASIKKTERFVFFFAGHGRKAPQFAIMPSDATISGVDIEPKALNDAIAKVQAKSRTVILDSCFSGGMAAGEMSRGADGFHARFFDGEQERSIKFGPPKSQASSNNTPEKFESSPGICYYTAALDSEQALEATMDDGKRHGLFSYGLIKNIKNGKLWSEVHNDVKKQMAKRLENSGRTQNPMISTQFMPTSVLDNVKMANPKAPPGKTLLDVWNSDSPNKDKVALRLKPDQDVQEAGKQIGLEVKVGQDGYLVILGQVGDRIYRFFPDSNRGEDAKVGKGTINFPTGRDRLFFDTFGADHVKAMLFSTAERAGSVLAALDQSGGKAQEIDLGKQGSEAFFTSRLSIAVGDSILGGSRLKNLDGLIKKVMSQKDDIGKYLVSRLKSASDSYEKGENWLVDFDAAKQPSIGDREVFMTLLNLAMQEGLLYDPNSMTGTKFPETVRSQIGRQLTGGPLWKVNRQILLTLYPDEVNADESR